MKDTSWNYSKESGYIFKTVIGDSYKFGLFGFWDLKTRTEHSATYWLHQDVYSDLGNFGLKKGLKGLKTAIFLFFFFFFLNAIV